MRSLSRLALCTALLVAPFTSARAADLSGALTDYPLGKVPATEQKADTARGMQVKIWLSPARLGADMALFLYPYKLGPDYWIFMISNPSGSVSEYLGTSQLTLVSQRESGGRMETVSRVSGGRFVGYMVEEIVPEDGGSRALALFPPRMADMVSRELSRLKLKGS